MLLELAIRFNWLLIVGLGAIFALVGLLFRRGPSGKSDRDNLVYADGFQGATVVHSLS